MTASSNVVCPHCDGVNRVPRNRDAAEARCGKCHGDIVIPIGGRRRRRCECGGRLESLMHDVVKKGAVVRKTDTPKRIRKRVVKSLEWLCL